MSILSCNYLIGWVGSIINDCATSATHSLGKVPFYYRISAEAGKRELGHLFGRFGGHE